LQGVFHHLSLILIIAAAAPASVGTADLLVLSSPGFPSVMMLGPGGSALCEGPEASSGNPALITTGFTAAGGKWNLGTTAVSTAAGFRVQGMDMSVSVRTLGRANIIRRDASGEATGGYSYSTGSMVAGLSFAVLPWLRAGLAAGTAWEKVDYEEGMGPVFSAGLAFTPSGFFRAGLAVDGLGNSPDWNGIHKAMPVRISMAAAVFPFTFAAFFAGASEGLNTTGSFGGGAVFSLADMEISGGYGFSPGEAEISGFFAGLRYSYGSRKTYVVELSCAERHDLSRPVMAGLSVRFR